MLTVVIVVGVIYAKVRLRLTANVEPTSYTVVKEVGVTESCGYSHFFV